MFFDFKTLIYSIKEITKMKKVKLTITLSPEIIKYLEDNYTKKSRFIELCIEKELEEYRKNNDKL